MIEKEICYDKEHALYLDAYLPETENYPVFLYFHGGGLEAGDKGKHELFYEHLMQNGIGVITANYRLYPNAKYPDFLEDSAKAAAWVFEKFPNHAVFIGGSSAGGYLSQMLCFDHRWLSAHGLSAMQVKGFIHDAGQPTCHFNILREKGIDSRRVMIDDTASIYHIGEDAEYPPMLVIVSDNDMGNRYDQTMLMISTLGLFGHKDNVELKVMHGTHCAYVNAADEQGESVFGKIICDYIYRTNKD